MDTSLPLARTPEAPTRAATTWRIFWLASALVVVVGLLVTVLDTDLSPGELMVEALVVGVMGAASMALVGSGSRARQAAGMLWLGVLGTGAGMGIGLVHLFSAGLTPVGLVGLAMLLAGIVLLVGGSAALVVALPRWWKLAAVPVLFVLAQFLLLPLAIAVAATHGARTPVSTPRPEAARAVTLATQDGVALAAWYWPSQNGAALVLLHGAGGQRGDTVAHATALARRGYGVLALDARGRGESGGRDMQWGWWGELDVTPAIDLLVRQPDVDPTRVGILGLSMGAEQALTVAAVDPRVAAVVAEGATGRQSADFDFLPDDPGGWITRANYGLGTVIADLLTAASPPAPLPDAVAALAERPVLLIAADDRTEHLANEAFVARTGGRAQLWEPAGVPHIQALSTLSAEWERRVLDFLDASL